MSSDYAALESQVLSEIKSLAINCDNYNALSRCVYNAIELAVMDRRTSVIDALLPVMMQYCHTSKSVITALAGGPTACCFATSRKQSFFMVSNRENAKSAFFSLKELRKSDDSWSGLLAYAKKCQKLQRPEPVKKSFKEAFESFLEKARKQYTEQEINQTLEALFGNN